jgi:hypothetical protein
LRLALGKNRRMNKPSHRRPEPEIIPPGVPLRGGSTVWVSGDALGGQYVYTKRVGPVGVALLTLGIGAVVGLSLLFLVGAAVIGLATIGVLTIAGVIAGLLRGPPRPLR